MRSEWIRIGYSDYGDVYLKRIGEKIQIKQYTPLDYDYMESYIRDNADALGEWQTEVYNWRTELGFDEWRENYDYDYGNWFSYDDEMDEYYDNDNSDTTWDYFYPTERSEDVIIEQVMSIFENDYNCRSFEWDSNMNEQLLREKISEYYNKCEQYEKELEESRKPHYNAFSYYK